MDLREIDARLEQLQDRPTYRTGELVYDLGQDRCLEVVQARPSCGTYKLSDGRWVSWYELESPLKQSSRRVVRRVLEQARERLQAEEQRQSLAQRRTLGTLAGLALAGLTALVLFA